MTPFGQNGTFYSGGIPVENERKRLGYVERFNPGVSVNGPVAEHGMYINPNHRSLDPMNHGAWNPMSTGHLDGDMMGNHRSSGQFDQTHYSLMNGSHINELPKKTTTPFYGHGRQMFKGRMSQMNMNQMNGNHMNQTMPQMNSLQVGGLMNVNQMNQLNVDHVNQINVGQVNQLNFSSMKPLNMGQFNRVNVGQMNMGQMAMGQTNMGQVNMDQMNIGQINLGQMSRGNMFVPKGSSSNEFPNKRNKTCHGAMDVNGMTHLQARSNRRQGQGQVDFMASNQQQGTECSPMRGGQRMTRKMMNNLDMNFDPMGALGGYGEPGVHQEQQVAFQGNMNHMGLGSMMNGQQQQSNHPIGGLRHCVDPANQVVVNNGQVNHPGQVNHAMQMNNPGQMNHHHHPCHRGSSSSSIVHGFNRSLDQSGFGLSNLGQPVIGQPILGQSTVGQPYIGQNGLGQPDMSKTAIGQSVPMDLDRISQVGVTSSGFGSPPELSMEEIFQSKNAYNSKQVNFFLMLEADYFSLQFCYSLRFTIFSCATDLVTMRFHVQ